MEKTILIPIDFSVESLNTLKLALDQHKHEVVNVILMYAQNLNSSITDQLFYSAPRIIQSLTTPEFSDALNILKNSYESTLKSLRVVLFHGLNSNAFSNFVEGHEINLIYIPKNYQLKPLKNGYNPIPIINKSKLPINPVAWLTGSSDAGSNELNLLFK